MSDSATGNVHGSPAHAGPGDDPATSRPVPEMLDEAECMRLVSSGELGVKTTLLNKTLRLNAAVFYQSYTDFQLNTFTAIQFVVTSLPKVVSKGVDLDFAWATPLPGFTISGGVTQDLTNINNFGSAVNQSYFCGGPGNTACTYRENDRLSFAPLWSGALSGSYQVPLTGSLGLRASLEEKYNSSYNTGSDLDPRKIQGAYGLLNGRLGIGALDESCPRISATRNKNIYPATA